MDTIEVPVRHQFGSYPILIGNDLLARADSFATLTPGDSGVIVTNTTVAPLYIGRLRAKLQELHSRVDVVELPDGEQHKTMHTLDIIFSALLSGNHDRKTTLFALGGGVVGDITGFAAATYMRGIDHVQIPTTLLAQTDSSVGGKTAVNHARGKNMIGAFHPPRLVVIDLDTLDSLPEREYVSGLAEVIKYGAVADRVFFDWLETNMSALLVRERATLAQAIKRSCEIKAEIVGLDERESGLRAILNFGHTTAHAIETGLGYGTWLHGEAVAAGMVVAARLSVGLGSLAAVEAQRLVALIAATGLPTDTPRLVEASYLELMRNDKKSERGRLKFVLLEGLGRAVVRPVGDGEALAAVEACHAREAPAAAHS